jgi:predicted aldo/keto reductase-like oxidoreductase
VEKIRFGRTGMMVSRLGFGGIPIQRLSEDEAVAVVKRCLDLGITFLDTANGYTTSEERIGKAIAGRRQDVVIATKTGARTPEDMEKHLQLSLERLNVDYIDLYQLHGVSDPKWADSILAPGGAADIMEGFKKSGRVKHIGVTSHQKDVAKRLVESDRFESLMFPFNFVSNDALEELLPLCRKHDMGFIAMKPMGGGMLENATVAFKYVFQFSDVLPIVGIEKAGEIEEICQLMQKPLAMTATEQQEMERLKKELGTRFCHRCDYCQPCQQGIQISMVLVFPSLVKRSRPESIVSGRMSAMMEKASTCIECHECEARCPYQRPIAEMIKEYYNQYEKLKSDFQKQASPA